MTNDELDRLEGILEQRLEDVREMCEGYPVELRRSPASGRLLLTAWNQGANAMTQIDLWDLIDWLKRGPIVGRCDDGFVLTSERKERNGSNAGPDHRRT
jgi:hypothetical protein